MLRTLSLFFVLIAVLLSIEASPRELLKEADLRYRRFDNLTAKMYYAKALALNPKSYEAMLGVLRAYNDLGEELWDVEDPKAEGFFQAAVDLGGVFLETFPQRPEAYFSFAVAKGNLSLFKGGRDKVLIGQDIEKLLTRAIELDPKFHYAYIVLGVYYREIASLSGFEKFFAELFFGSLPQVTKDQALATIQKSLDLMPTNNLFAFYEFARTLDRMKKREDAKVWYQKFLELEIQDHRQHVMRKTAEDRLKALAR